MQNADAARLLSTAMLVLTAVLMLSLAAIVLTGVHGQSGPLTIQVLVCVVLIYALSRTRHVAVAALGSVTLAHSLALSIVLREPSSETALLFLVPITITGLLRPIRGVILSQVASFTLILLAVHFVPGEWARWQMALTLMIAVSLILSTSITMLRRSRDQVRERTRQLARNEARLRAAIEGNPHQFFIVDAVQRGDTQDFELVMANSVADSAISARVGSVKTGASVVTYLDSLHPRLSDIVRRVMAIQRTVVEELTLTNGLACEIMAIPLSTGVAISLADVSLRKQAEQQRVELGLERERMRLLRTFVSDASHDLNTPLAIMVTNLYLIKQSSPDTRVAAYADKTMDQARRLSSMIKDMLRLSELDAMSDENVTLRKVDINTFVERVTAEFVPVAESRRQHLTFVPACAPVFALIDPARFEPALNNLIENATKYIPEGGTIEVGVAATAGQVVISVADDGPGIAEEDLPHLFERFYRGQKHRPANSGTGLGLAIARRTVEMHRGSLIASNRPAGGALFTVRMPVDGGR